MDSPAFADLPAPPDLRRAGIFVAGFFENLVPLFGIPLRGIVRYRLADHTFLFLLLTPFEFPPSEGGKKGGRLICFNAALEPVVQYIVDAASLKPQFHDDP